MKKEQKFFTLITLFYWVAIFIATHIPVPKWVGQMGVSDKTMHFFAYMVLAILLRLGTNFKRRLNWKKSGPWILLMIIIFYGAADEITQQYFNRSTDFADFSADLLGLAIALIISSILSSYHLAMILVIICPIFAPAIVRSNLIAQGSMLEIISYIAGFAFVTACWVKYLSFEFDLNLQKTSHLPMFFLPPAATALIVKIYALSTGKPFNSSAVLFSFTSIIVTIIFWRILSKKKAAI